MTARFPSRRLVLPIIAFALLLGACTPVTVGTERATELDTSSPDEGEAVHGTRLYCPVSHFSHDDPVVKPGQPDAAHLHMFWGNTQTNAFTTAESLANQGAATCEGGRNNQSAYWIPALFNEDDEVVLPEEIIVYYKSFASSGGFDRDTIMAIPDGLELLADLQVNDAGDYFFKREAIGGGLMQLTVTFPMCIAVDGNGDPVLASPDNRAHLSYANGSGETTNDCPTTHPYRIPGLIYNVRYDLDINTDWYLASDTNRNDPGHSLHGDYIASWDAATMDAVVLCQREQKRECQFKSADGEFRGQLPERFLDPDGNVLYIDSTTLHPSADRTPFGTSLTPMAQ